MSLFDFFWLQLYTFLVYRHRFSFAATYSLFQRNSQSLEMLFIFRFNTISQWEHFLEKFFFSIIFSINFKYVHNSMALNKPYPLYRFKAYANREGWFNSNRHWWPSLWCLENWLSKNYIWRFFHLSKTFAWGHQRSN